MLVPCPLAVQFDFLLLKILLLFFIHLIKSSAFLFFSLLIWSSYLSIFTIYLSGWLLKLCSSCMDMILSEWLTPTLCLFYFLLLFYFYLSILFMFCFNHVMRIEVVLRLVFCKQSRHLVVWNNSTWTCSWPCSIF